MSYVIIGDSEFKNENELESFKEFLKHEQIENLILNGDFSEGHNMKASLKWLKENKIPTEYLKGNTEAKVNGLKLKTMIYGWDIEHGQRFDPTYSKFVYPIISSKTKIGNFLLKNIQKIRGSVKSAYGDQDSLTGDESCENACKFGKNLPRNIKAFIEKLFLSYLYQRTKSKNIILGHFHFFNGKGYHMGDKKIILAPRYPKYICLTKEKIYLKK